MRAGHDTRGWRIECNGRERIGERRRCRGGSAWSHYEKCLGRGSGGPCALERGTEPVCAWTEGARPGEGGATAATANGNRRHAWDGLRRCAASRCGRRGCGTQRIGPRWQIDGDRYLRADRALVGVKERGAPAARTTGAMLAPSTHMSSGSASKALNPIQIERL